MLPAADLREDTVLLDSLVESLEKTVESFTLGSPYVGQPGLLYREYYSERIIRRLGVGVNQAWGVGRVAKVRKGV